MADGGGGGGLEGGRRGGLKGNAVTLKQGAAGLRMLTSRQWIEVQEEKRDEEYNASIIDI